MKYTYDEMAAIALDSLIGFEYKNQIKILESVKSPSILLTDKQQAVKSLAFLGEAKAKTVIMSLTGDYIKSVIASLEKRSLTAVTLYSEGYPERLKHIDTPPLVLYCKGDISLLSQQKTVGVVGSRKTLPYAEALLKDVCKNLCRAQITIITGSASGADEAALVASVDSGRIISVLAGGIDHVYPGCNKSIIEKVAKNGLVISEHPPEVAPAFWMFPVRNRIIAGLSDAVLIASGGKKSGARHTADFALNYGRQVFAFPYSVGIQSGELCNSLIKSGAALCDGYKDILDELGVTLDEEETVIDLCEEERVLYEAIKDGKEDMTAYCMENNLQFYRIAPSLSSLEIQGLIVKTAGNRYKPVK